MSKPIRLGLLRLVDSAPLILADANGLFRKQGIDVEISVEASWADVADKMTNGTLDTAVMLPPLVLAACAGLVGPKARLVVPLSLSQGGNTIVASNEAAAALIENELTPRPGLLLWLRAQQTRPRFAVAHAFSTHNLLLRYWLASGGASVDRDVETVDIPPEDVVEALAAGSISGFCAGAPWGDVAEARQAGRILIGTSAIWPFHPEKCICVGEAWAEANPEPLYQLLRAVLQAQSFCDQPSEAAGIAALLADPNGLGLPEAACRAALAGGSGAELIRFHTGETWFPARAHAIWFLGQMRRWGWLDEHADVETLATQVYRPDLLASAVDAEGLYPAAGLPALEGTAMLPMPDDDTFAPRGRR
jgi:ABC-type nitrate/sulfonate/bicarbonate transport system substrate-binding protein